MPSATVATRLDRAIARYEGEVTRLQQISTVDLPAAQATLAKLIAARQQISPQVEAIATLLYQLDREGL